MKTISVRQPWAYLLCAGVKDIENRTWKLPEKYKGERVLIHASATKQSAVKVLSPEQKKIIKDADMWRFVAIPDTSAIIGSVRFVDCVINHPSIWAEKSEPILFDDYGFPIEYEHKTYNWVVEDPILFGSPIMGVKGKLSFWEYEEGVTLYLEGAEESIVTYRPRRHYIL